MQHELAISWRSEASAFRGPIHSDGPKRICQRAPPERLLHQLGSSTDGGNRGWAMGTCPDGGPRNIRVGAVEPDGTEWGVWLPELAGNRVNLVVTVTMSLTVEGATSIFIGDGHIPRPTSGSFRRGSPQGPRGPRRDTPFVIQG